MRVPQDMAVVGFDDIRAAKMSTPPLTTFRYSLDVMADEAVRAVLAHRLEPSQPPVRLVGDAGRADDPAIHVGPVANRSNIQRSGSM